MCYSQLIGNSCRLSCPYSSLLKTALHSSIHCQTEQGWTLEHLVTDWGNGMMRYMDCAKSEDPTHWKWLVASLRLVSPGAVTDGVTLFTTKKWWPFISHRHSHPLHLSTWLLVQCSCKFTAKIFMLSFGCHLPGWFHPGRSVPHPLLVTPLKVDIKSVFLHLGELQLIFKIREV